MALSMGTNGVRGLLAQLGPNEAMRLGFGFAKWRMGQSPPKDAAAYRIAIARDMRLTSPMLMQAACSGVMAAGCEALDIGLLPSPLAEWAATKYDADGLIIVTASHNPPEWNALKFVDGNGVAVSRERGEKICAFQQNSLPPLPWQKIGRLGKIDGIIETYISHAASFASDLHGSNPGKGLSVIFDPGNGTSTLAAPKLLEKLGAKVKVINGTLDGTFPSRPSEPTEKNVAGLIKAVLAEAADFGVACDGDSDRVVFVDDKGRWLVGDKGVAIHAINALAKTGKNKPSPAVITTVATSRVVEDVVSANGGSIQYVKVGAPYISEAMLEHNAVFGGEEVGGIIYPGFSLAKDGILAAAMLLGMAKEKPISKWHDALPKYFNAKTKIECAPAKKQTAMSSLATSLPASSPSAKPNLADGIRLDFPDAWVIIRASGTENYFRIFAEAKSQEKAESLMNKFAAIVKDALN